MTIDKKIIYLKYYSSKSLNFHYNTGSSLQIDLNESDTFEFFINIGIS
jgi:hypothetical protein